ncbi:MAG: DUF296 domain-containing protein [Candidatus Diapherotrites archaeon]
MIAANEKFKSDETRKNLRVVFEEGESILPGIQNAMNQHKLKEAEIKEGSGKIKKAKIGYIDNNKKQEKVFEDFEPLRMNGTMKLSFGDLYGEVYLSFIQNKEPVKGQMLSGIADDDLEIIMEVQKK